MKNTRFSENNGIFPFLTQRYHMALEDLEDICQLFKWSLTINVHFCFHSTDVLLSVYCSNEEKQGQQMVTE